jgi:hypothetical protein
MTTASREASRRAQQRLAQRGHGAGIVFILIVHRCLAIIAYKIVRTSRLIRLELGLLN